ncbi:MAG TPA: YihY/virulence factor BrkB family protein [Actinomycetota bacterium]|nr:YihY/virulence factor BrkB family protein [Actinomycetota bacterium]
MNIGSVATRAKMRVEVARADHSFVDIAVRTFKRYSADDGGSYAAALTYYTFFSIFPLLLFGASIMGWITQGNEELRGRLLTSSIDAIPLLRDVLSPNGLKIIETNKGSLALTGAAMALYAGTGAIIALQHALNKVYRVSDEPNFFQKRLKALMWLGIFGSAGILSIGLSAGAGFAAGDNTLLVPLLGIAAGLVVSTFIFATAFKVLPGKTIAWREALPGAIVAAVCFEALKFFGSAYLARGETMRNDTFGTFAAAAGLLVASYLISQITLMSAEVNAALAERRVTRQSSQQDKEDR